MRTVATPGISVNILTPPKENYKTLFDDLQELGFEIQQDETTIAVFKPGDTKPIYKSTWYTSPSQARRIIFGIIKQLNGDFEPCKTQK